MPYHSLMTCSSSPRTSRRRRSTSKSSRTGAQKTNSTSTCRSLEFSEVELSQQSRRQDYTSTSSRSSFSKRKTLPLKRFANLSTLAQLFRRVAHGSAKSIDSSPVPARHLALTRTFSVMPQYQSTSRYSWRTLWSYRGLHMVQK